MIDIFQAPILFLQDPAPASKNKHILPLMFFTCYYCLLFVWTAERKKKRIPYERFKLANKTDMQKAYMREMIIIWWNIERKKEPLTGIKEGIRKKGCGMKNNKPHKSYEAKKTVFKLNIPYSTSYSHEIVLLLRFNCDFFKRIGSFCLFLNWCYT